MKPLATLLVPLAFFTVTAAQAALPDVPDTDGSGSWSLVELQAVWTDLTEDGFKAIDTSADGAVDPVELQAALDGGVITAPAGN
ncbi:MAG: EF-hand domain-containing protein [Rhodobacterales bacterium]|nr:EF-hand domain-containing protein [Rhodobacterales bacterium]